MGERMGEKMGERMMKERKMKERKVKMGRWLAHVVVAAVRFALSRHADTGDLPRACASNELLDQALLSLGIVL